MTSTALSAFQTAFRLPRLTFAETDHWVLSTRPQQLTLGAMVLSSRSGATGWPEMDPAAGVELVGILAAAEATVREIFGAEKFNAVCLMMKDPVVHFHLLPRYSRTVERYGHRWRDTAWPGAPVFGGASDGEEHLDVITEELRRAYQRR